MAEIKKQNILITGATGFIGKHIAKNLLNQGHNLFILMRNPFKFKKDNIIRHSALRKTTYWELFRYDETAYHRARRTQCFFLDS